jgi:hypothetical protein
VNRSGSILAGGLALILGALAFLGVFAYLAATFDYPKVLDGPAERVLPALLATGGVGRFALVADANNYLLPLWMIGFGVALVRYGRPRETAG